MTYDKLFIGGDFSGIQKFLYTITSRHASLSLKGRSTYIRQKMDAIYEGMIKSIEKAGGKVEEKEKLYCSGGKFYLITNNSDKIVTVVENYARNEEESLWKEHRGQLWINFSCIAFRINDEKFYVEGHEDEDNKESGVLWKYANMEFARKKSQKFKTHILSHPNSFFSFDAQDEDSKNLVVGSGHKVCALTGIEFDVTKLEKGKSFIADDGLFYHPSALKQIRLGREMREKEEQTKKLKSFEDYAMTDGGSPGDTYLGVLRMDVDGMGKKFIIGFPTLEKYKEFSNLSTKFFETDIREKLLEKFKEHVNIIYAGGDDLFIVGRWDKVIEFAKLIHSKTEELFKDYGYEDPFCNNKRCEISISGGIAIVKPKFPISKAAEMAADAESASKEGDKNAFNMFGETLSWKTCHSDGNDIVYKFSFTDEDDNVIRLKHEFEYVEYFKDKFLNYISSYSQKLGFSKSLIHKIMLYSDLAKINDARISNGLSPDYSYIWHSSYFITRYMNKFKSNMGEYDDKRRLYFFCKKLRDEQLTDKRRLRLLSISARWAELLLKDGNVY